MSSLSKLLAKQLLPFNPNGVATVGKQDKAPLRKEPVIPKIDKLRVAAKNYPCVLCGRNKRFTVAAHCNDVADKGIGKTAPNFMLAYLCNVAGGCHDQVDGKVPKMTKADKRGMWNEAHRRTVAIWFRDGLVVPA
jgi:hypothetical protein